MEQMQMQEQDELTDEALQELFDEALPVVQLPQAFDWRGLRDAALAECNEALGLDPDRWPWFNDGDYSDVLSAEDRDDWIAALTDEPNQKEIDAQQAEILRAALAENEKKGAK